MAFKQGNESMALNWHGLKLTWIQVGKQASLVVLDYFFCLNLSYQVRQLVDWLRKPSLNNWV